MEVTQAQLEMYGKQLELKNTAPNRWSSAVMVFERILESWTGVFRGLFLRSNAHIHAPVKDQRKKMLEALVVLKPVNVVLKELQASDSTTGARVPFLINTLLATSLDTNQPLRVEDPETPRLVDLGKRILNSSTSDNSDVEESDDGIKIARAYRMRQPQDMTKIGLAMREGLRFEIEERFLEGRYRNPVPSCSYLYGAAAMANPYYLEMKWVDLWCTSAEAAVIKAKIRGVIVKQLEVVLAAGDGEDMCGNEKAGGGGGDGLMQLTLGRAVARRPASGGAALFGMESGSDDSDAEVDPATIKEYGERCKNEGKGWKHRGWQQMLQLWACDADGKAEGKGARELPALARVFRCLLGVPGSAAILERDFSMAANLLTNRRTVL
ncbi:Hypothetical protein NocV09_09600010 [Nannochloropsis oceanica]